MALDFRTQVILTYSMTPRKTVYTIADMKALLRGLCDSEGSLRKAARYLGVSAAYLSDALNGHQEPGDKLTRRLGYVKHTDRIVTYRRVAS